jgi:hypothetical protein
MDCAEFLGGFSEVADGLASEERREAAELHAQECPSCRRYRAVLRTGTEILRSLPDPDVRDDFGPRLEHRLFHVADELADPDAGSATPALTVLGMAVLLTVVAWSPILGRAPVVELDPIVVSRPPSARMLRPMNALPGFSQPTRSWTDLSKGLWDDPRALLYEYSELSQRYRRVASAGRARVDRDR